jgi:hypothetical protein
MARKNNELQQKQLTLTKLASGGQRGRDGKTDLLVVSESMMTTIMPCGTGVLLFGSRNFTRKPCKPGNLPQLLRKRVIHSQKIVHRDDVKLVIDGLNRSSRQDNAIVDASGNKDRQFRVSSGAASNRVDDFVAFSDDTSDVRQLEGDLDESTHLLRDLAG